MKLNLDKFNWYGLDHAAVLKKYNATRYVGTFCIDDHYEPSAVYYSENPDRSKGHKNYVLFFRAGVADVMYVTGRDAEEMEKHRFQTGRYCMACDEVVYSVMRHDCRFCSCKQVMIDGGRDYVRASVLGCEVTVDLIKGTAESV